MYRGFKLLPFYIPRFNSWQINFRQMTSIAQKRRQMAEKNLTEKRNITPEIAVRILKKEGIEIDEKKALEVLDMLYFLAILIVDQNFKT